MVRLETVQEKAGLDINPVAKTHLFLKHAGLANKFIDDIYLKVDGKREQFEEIFHIVVRTAKQH